MDKNTDLYIDYRTMPFVATQVFKDDGCTHVVFISNGDGTGDFYFADNEGYPLTDIEIMSIGLTGGSKYSFGSSKESPLRFLKTDNEIPYDSPREAWSKALALIGQYLGETVSVKIHLAVKCMKSSSSEYLEVIGVSRLKTGASSLVRTYGVLKSDNGVWRMLNRYFGTKTRIVPNGNLEYRILVQDPEPDNEGKGTYHDFDAMFVRKRRQDEENYR